MLHASRAKIRVAVALLVAIALPGTSADDHDGQSQVSALISSTVAVPSPSSSTAFAGIATSSMNLMDMILATVAPVSRAKSLPDILHSIEIGTADKDNGLESEESDLPETATGDTEGDENDEATDGHQATAGSPTARPSKRGEAPQYANQVDLGSDSRGSKRSTNRHRRRAPPINANSHGPQSRHMKQKGGMDAGVAPAGIQRKYNSGGKV